MIFSKQKLLLPIYFLWIIFLSVIYFIAVGAQINKAVPFIWALIGFSGVTAIIIGIKRFNPAAWLGWLFLAIANLLFILGDTQYNVQEYIFNRSNSFPSIADVFYLLTYPLFIAGMYVFIRRRTAGHSERGAVLDAAIFALGLAMFVWVYLVIPNVTADTAIGIKALSVAYPLFDILVWAMLVRLLLTGIRIRAVQFLAIGAMGLIISDIAYGINQFYGVWSNGSFIDIGWIFFYSFWGAAALHSSMKVLDRPMIRTPKISIAPLILLAFTALIAPALLIIETIRRNAERVSITIAIFAAVLFILVILRMSLLVREISQREAEVVLEKKKNEAFSIVSHQLKTPVTVVKQIISIILDGFVGKVPPKQRKLLLEAYEGNQRLLKIVEDLLSVGQVDSGKMRLHKSNTNVVELIKRVIKEHKAQVAKRGQKIIFNHTDRKLMADIDPDRINMVLENIIDNAIKYSPDGKDIGIELTKLKRTIKIIVKDQGIGIEQNDLERLFQKFSRIENSHSKEISGTGIGLYWAKKIVDQHGGSIKVKSKTKRGSSFIVTLPL